MSTPAASWTWPIFLPRHPLDYPGTKSTFEVHFVTSHVICLLLWLWDKWNCKVCVFYLNRFFVIIFSDFFTSLFKPRASNWRSLLSPGTCWENLVILNLWSFITFWMLENLTIEQGTSVKVARWFLGLTIAFFLGHPMSPSVFPALNIWPLKLKELLLQRHLQKQFKIR